MVKWESPPPVLSQTSNKPIYQVHIVPKNGGESQIINGGTLLVINKLGKPYSVDQTDGERVIVSIRDKASPDFFRVSNTWDLAGVLGLLFAAGCLAAARVASKGDGE